MGRSLKSRIKNFFCCFHDAIEEETADNEDVREITNTVERGNERKLRIVNAPRSCDRTIRVKAADAVQEKVEEYRRFSAKTSYLQLVLSCRYEVFEEKQRYMEAEKKIKVVCASIGRNVEVGYCENSLLHMAGADDDHAELRVVKKTDKFTAFKQGISTYQGRRPNRRMVNNWSRHLSQPTSQQTSNLQLLYANVNLNKGLEELNVRPKGAGRVRTRHSSTEVSLFQRGFYTKDKGTIQTNYEILNLNAGHI